MKGKASRVWAQLPTIDSSHQLTIKEITIPKGFSANSIKSPTPYIGLVEEGGMDAELNLKRYDIFPGDIMVIHPHTTVTIFKTPEQTRIRVLAFDTTLVSNLIMDFTEYLPSIIKTDIGQVLSLNDQEQKIIRAWFDLIQIQTAPDTIPISQRLGELIMSGIHIQILEMVLSHHPKVQRKRTRKEELMARFLMEVGKHSRKERSVIFYAAKLFVTPKHLSATVKELTGETAIKFITRFVIIEAQIMLRSSNMTIQQIAEALNFPNQSFFGKYFKKATGQSPNAYRQSYRRQEE